MPYYVGVSNNTGDRKSGANSNSNQKVNLKDIQAHLVKRGKPSYENPTLEADIRSLDPTVEGDAFFWAEAVVNLKGDPKKVQAEKMKYRNRALSVAERVGVDIQVRWLEDGRMVIALGTENDKG